MNHGRAITSVGVEDLDQIDGLLQLFLGETQARCALIVDRSGRLFTTAGDTGALDRVTFASLVAGDFAASAQLATLLGEQEFSSLYHHGEGRSMYLADIEGWAILAALFDGRTTLGMIRLKTKSVVPTLARHFETIAARTPVSVSSEFSGAWAEEAESQIDRLFAEG